MVRLPYLRMRARHPLNTLLYNSARAAPHGMSAAMGRVR